MRVCRLIHGKDSSGLIQCQFKGKSLRYVFNDDHRRHKFDRNPSAPVDVFSAFNTEKSTWGREGEGSGQSLLLRLLKRCAVIPEENPGYQTRTPCGGPHAAGGPQPAHGLQPPPLPSSPRELSFPARSLAVLAVSVCRLGPGGGGPQAAASASPARER